MGTDESRRTTGADGHEIAVVDGADVWGYVDLTLAKLHPAGYGVHATDGEIGKVDRASNEPGSTYLVVDTGPWIFGKKVVIPAGLVERADPDTETVFVRCTKDEIKNAPEYDEAAGVSDEYRGDLGAYYASRGTMPRDPSV
jgi:hypothetical protein